MQAGHERSRAFALGRDAAALGRPLHRAMSSDLVGLMA